MIVKEFTQFRYIHSYTQKILADTCSEKLAKANLEIELNRHKFFKIRYISEILLYSSIFWGMQLQLLQNQSKI